MSKLFALYRSSDNGNGFPERLVLHGVYRDTDVVRPQRQLEDLGMQTLVVSELKFPHLKAKLQSGAGS